METSLQWDLILEEFSSDCTIYQSNFETLHQQNFVLITADINISPTYGLL